MDAVACHRCGATICRTIRRVIGQLDKSVRVTRLLS
jgi:hypothetical protein